MAGSQGLEPSQRRPAFDDGGDDLEGVVGGVGFALSKSSPPVAMVLVTCATQITSRSRTMA